VKAQENIKRFFRKDLTSFFMLLQTFDLLLAYLQIVIVSIFKNRLELVKNIMQIMYITLILMCKYR